MRILKKIAGWQQTIWFPLLYAVLGAVAASATMTYYIPVFLFFAVAMVFAAIFCEDEKVMLIPVFLTFYSMGSDIGFPIPGGEDAFGTFSSVGFICMIACGAVIFFAIVYKFAKKGYLREIGRNNSAIGISFILMSLSFLLNGLFSPYAGIGNLLWGALETVALIFCYFCLRPLGQRRKELCSYICWLLVCMGISITIQLVILCGRLYADNDLYIYIEDVWSGFQKINMSFPWGNVNIAGALLAVSILAALYLSFTKESRFVPGVILSTVFYGMMVFTNARASIMLGSIVFAIITVAFIIRKRKTKQSRLLVVYLLSLLFVCSAIFIIKCGGFSGFFENLTLFFRFKDKDTGRFELWKAAWNDFVSSPSFGVGFLKGSVDVARKNIYAGFYHNIIFEVLGALGIAGAAAFVFHEVALARDTLRSPSFEKILLVTIMVTIQLISLLDNFFWYPNFQMIYAAIAAFAEGKLFLKDSDALSLK